MHRRFLCRLVESGGTQSRRGDPGALGLFGTFQCNASVAQALRDNDLTVVRRMASDALWAIWFRADTDENNKTLENVSKLIARQRDGRGDPTGHPVDRTQSQVCRSL